MAAPTNVDRGWPVDHGWRFFQAVAVDHLQLLWPLPAFGTASLHKRQLHVVNPGCHKPTLTVGWFMALGLPDYLKSELFHCLPEQRWAGSHSKRWSFKGSICAPHEKCGYGTLAVNTPPPSSKLVYFHPFNCRFCRGPHRSKNPHVWRFPISTSEKSPSLENFAHSLHGSKVFNGPG